MAFWKILFSLTLCLCLANIVHSEFEALECLNVPTREFVGSVNATIKTIQQVSSVLSGFAGVMDNFRLSIAVRDCQDLVDTSVEELSWVVSASLNGNSKENGTGNMNSDMKTWLSGALIDQETCKEGLDGINGTVKNLISSNLDLIASSLHELLSMVKPTTVTAPDTIRGSKKSKTHEKFPIWLSPHDQNLLNSTNTTVDVVVAADGTGNFSRIGDAIAAAPEYSAKRYVIHIKRGVYYEYVAIKKEKWNIMIVGDGMDETVIRGNHSHPDGLKTYDSATFAVKGKGFIARDITFENTAGPHKEQAVAFMSDSDESVLYHCAFRGFQDTLYAHKNRQFYRECHITGTVDFICGHAAAVFQNCQIKARKGLVGQKNTITAQSRNCTENESGFSIQYCNISVEQDILNLNITYLGRPWKQYSRTVVMQSYIGDGINPKGWLEWKGDLFLDSLYYGEYMNYGPGAGLAARVKWPGYHIFNDSAQADPFTVSKLIIGDKWIPATGIGYTSGLAHT
ncbi:probable pectinesterase/pectinesterase inhibitor 32 [Primulina huaijiensis]|uniref:probable pectinesterase/pectinesterase inhibitor 32 n=1 Tax=Primulina huaijiensis TaxID=1492673 RepID=UPI003CC7703E